MDGTPDTLRGERHFEMTDTETGERVDARVYDHGKRRGGAPFTARTNPQGIGCRGYLADLGDE